MGRFRLENNAILFHSVSSIFDKKLAQGDQYFGAQGRQNPNPVLTQTIDQKFNIQLLENQKIQIKMKWHFGKLGDLDQKKYLLYPSIQIPNL